MRSAWAGKLLAIRSAAALLPIAALALACSHAPAPPAPVPAPVAAPRIEAPANTIDEARTRRVAGNLDTYERSLRFLSLSADLVTSRRAVALLGLFEFEQKRWDDAFETLTKAAAAGGSVVPFLELRLIDIEQQRNHGQNAAAIAGRIIATAPDSAAAAMARLRLPALYAELGDAAATDAAYAQAIATPIDELTEGELVSLATRLDTTSRHDLASSIRMHLLTAFPRGRFTEKTYGQLAASAESPLNTLSFEESLAIVRSLVHNDRYDQAFDMLDRIARRFPEPSNAAYRNERLRALFGSRRYPELIRESAGHALDPPAMLLRARAEWRSGNPEAFLRGLKQIERQFPSSKEAVEAKVLRARYDVTDVTDYESAVKNLRSAIDSGALGKEGENLWSLGWTYVLWGRDSAALATFDEYVKRFPDGDYTTNSLFWAGKIFDKARRTEERDAKFHALIDAYPYSYFSYRAREIVGDPSLASANTTTASTAGWNAASPNGEVPSAEKGLSGDLAGAAESRGFAAFPDLDAQVATVNDLRLDTVRELEAIDLPRDASLEMKRVAASHPDNLGVQFMLADVYVRGGEPFKANGILQRRFRQFVRHGGTNIPHRFWEILFPLNNWPAIRAEAEKRGVDPYLIASIIRQESGFEPHAVSNAGAVGLMQIMPAEALSIASRAGIQGVTRESLFDPATNIAVGVAEYSQKLADMGGQSVLAIASYNAGEEPVGRWLNHTAVEDVDLFVEAIPYAETRLYVKSVTRNRFEYRRIYERTAVPQ